MKKAIGLMLYPAWCPICGTSTDRVALCPTCRKQLRNLEEPLCKCCGKPIADEELEYCFDCIHHPHYFEEGRSLWLHEDGVRSSVYDFKFHNIRENGIFFAGEMAQRFQCEKRRWNPDVIIPVPLHRKKEKKRGYNQAEILGQELGRIWEIPVETEAVIRRENTTPLKELNNRQRRKEVARSFAIKKDWKPEKTVLLVDDIYTTGSTLDGIAGLLKAKGVEKVYFLTITIGQGF